MCGSEEFTAASTPCPREFEMWGREGHIKGDKADHCASRGKEMQIKQTKSVEVLHSKPPSVSVETNGVLVLFIKCIWFSTI